MADVHRRQAERRLRQLDLPPPSPRGVEAWCQAIGERRGRPIHLLPLDSTSDTTACGLWLATDNADYFAVDRGAPPILRRHILLHELAHMFCGHSGRPVINSDTITFDRLDPAIVRRVLARSLSNDEEEREAEVFADVMAQWLAQHSRSRPRRFHRRLLARAAVLPVRAATPAGEADRPR
ncbi:hypothetical protein [Phytohabitans rumicis]|uniref:IrrE N-terminal-like domain-containing protein n=1 Tax=Phytohabitans rumicis TaxID=1076125 RepID=A0A6V8LEW5_9ACTN|nr:hypothetical protein [Phytohabitans rumicis]GFJ93149.1 hypothetical protein Prum_067910 [Phytohabitans rumicis]